MPRVLSHAVGIARVRSKGRAGAATGVTDTEAGVADTEPPADVAGASSATVVTDTAAAAEAQVAAQAAAAAAQAQAAQAQAIQAQAAHAQAAAEVLQTRVRVRILRRALAARYEARDRQAAEHAARAAELGAAHAQDATDGTPVCSHGRCHGREPRDAASVAVESLQAAWRGRCARRAYEQQLLQLEAQHRAATAVQRIVRGSLSRANTYSELIRTFL